MQVSNALPQADAILDWLQNEMGYPVSSQYASSEDPLPPIDSLRRICRGNMLPLWKFLLEKVKSEKTVEKIKRNIIVHGTIPSSGSDPKRLPSDMKDRETGIEDRDQARSRRDRKKGNTKNRGKAASAELAGRGKEIVAREEGVEGNESRESASKEREAAELEVERLRHVLQRLRKELKGRMFELSREEGQRQRILDDKSNSRHKQVMLESYDQKCEQVIRIFTEYHRRLHCYVEHARDVQRGKVGGADAISDSVHPRSKQDMVYATSITGSQPSEGEIVFETTAERNIGKACESLAEQMIERIKISFPAYDGDGSQRDTQLEEMTLSMEMDEEAIPENVRETAWHLLRDPPQLLNAMAAYTGRVVALIRRETEKIDIRADAERLRYKYENNKITEDTSAEIDEKSFLQKRGTGTGKVGIEAASKGTFRQLQERQRAHVQKFMATEEALNQAAEARKSSEELIKQIHGASKGGEASGLISTREFAPNAGSLRQFELEVWSKERELAGLKASVATLTAEVQRLKNMCEERKAAEDALRRKWKRIEDFDARRTELEFVYTALLHAISGAAASWEQHTKAAREHSEKFFIPVCDEVQEKALGAHDLVEREISAFQQVPDNRLYMLPASTQALLDSSGVNSTTDPEALTVAEKNAECLTARASAGDPSAIPSICRIAATLQPAAGYDGPDAGLAAVVESMRFFRRPCSSPANLLEDLSKAISQAQTLEDLVGSGRSLLSNANRFRPEYERSAIACSLTSGEQEKIALKQWLPELKSAVQEAQRCLEDCKRVRGLVDEWWEQPAAIAVDWITIDGQNVAGWLAHVKQLQTTFYDKQLL